jgi:hypothetical protein
MAVKQAQFRLSSSNTVFSHDDVWWLEAPANGPANRAIVARHLGVMGEGVINCLERLVEEQASPAERACLPPRTARTNRAASKPPTAIR